MSTLRRCLTGALLMLIALPNAVAHAGTSWTGDVPLRVVAEAADAKVEWAAESQTVMVTTADGVRATVRIGETAAMIGEQQVPLERPASLSGGRTMVSGTFLHSLLGIPFQYDSETGTAKVDPLAQKGFNFYKALVNGMGGEYHGEFTPQLQAAMPEAFLSQIPQVLAQFGEAGRAQVVDVYADGVHHNVELTVPFSLAPLRVVVRFADNGQIDDFYIGPFQPSMALGSPAYAGHGSFVEEEIVLGNAPWSLPATLTLPTGEGSFPVVILVHGSGPHDRDETFAALKPFRDIAHGLASEGVAVLRYEKRTLQHSQKFMANPQYTLQQETVEDALLAAAHMASHPGIDADRIFVLGHSLGGMALPRILEQDQDGLIRGGIMLGAPNDFGMAIVKQNQLAAQNGEVPPGQVLFIMGQMAMLNSPEFDPADPPPGYALGMPYYYHDLMKRVSDGLLRTAQPILVLQGQRDFQVPVSEFESLKDALGERANVTYRLYPALNHFFTAGEGGISSSAEYYHPAHVAEEVIDDILQWLTNQ